jgi:hypothetical protein
MEINMSMVRNAMSVALLLVTLTGVAAQADNPLTTGCSAAAQRTEAEGGGVGTVNMTTRKTESEGGGVGYQPTPGARRTEAEGGGVGTVNMATRKTDAESTGAGTADHSAQMAAAVPCK